MQLPNIYAQNYDWYVLIPAMLVFASAFAILVFPGISYGIDLRGGALITLHSSSQVDTDVINNLLHDYGLKDFSTRSYATAVGHAAEIELPTDERIKAIEGVIHQISILAAKYDEQVAELIRLRGINETTPTEEIAQKILETEAQVNLTANELLSLGNLALNKIREIEKVNVTLADPTKVRESVRTVFQIAKEKYYGDLISRLLHASGANSYSLEEISPTLSAYFIDRATEIALVAAVLTFVLVFLIFRVPTPSFAVLIGAGCDVTIALGAMAIFGIPLNLPTFATLIILAGLSLDTNTMLTIRTIKHKEGTPRSRAYEAMRTGLAMTTTTIAAFMSLLILGLITKISIYAQIGAVAVAGLIGDIFATWLLNAPLVLWYLEGKYAKIAGIVPILKK